jgi:hypothetical protein
LAANPKIVRAAMVVRGKPKRETTRRAERAKALASKAIDQLTEETPDNDEKADRKRRLITGPKEFRDARIDRPKAKEK